MFRYSLIFGSIIGVIVIAFMIAVMLVMGTEDLGASELMGYAVMLAVLSLVFIGIKRFRDVEHGGVIKFTQAAAVGIGIAAVAGVFYVISWEFFLYATDFAFVETYSDSLKSALDAEQLGADERAAKLAEIEESMAMYANPLFRLPITFIEIFPVGLVVALISAFILKNPKVLPARATA
ncbi:MAG: DUF4199 domain-containing protein [Erythrobacter sp.]|nr:DUF4199 domain-containing protein [Erythrobacter sp.]